MRAVILGSGGSSGTPAVDWGWGACDPGNPRNRRLRPSLLVEEGETRILVDTSPDLREQLLSAGVQTLSAVLLTHFHADHLHGIDDLRPVNRMMHAPLDLYADAETLTVVRERFGYVLEPLDPSATVYYKPVLVPHQLHDRDAVTIGDIPVTTFVQDHGYCNSLGFRFGDIGYTTDVVNLPEHAFDMLAGIRVWIIGVLAEKPHPTHVHIDKALQWIDRVGPERAVFTHLSGRSDYDALAGRLPDGVEPAFDGMVLQA